MFGIIPPFWAQPGGNPVAIISGTNSATFVDEFWSTTDGINWTVLTVPTGATLTGLPGRPAQSGANIVWPGTMIVSNDRGLTWRIPANPYDCAWVASNGSGDFLFTGGDSASSTTAGTSSNAGETWSIQDDSGNGSSYLYPTWADSKWHAQYQNSSDTPQSAWSATGASGSWTLT